MHKQIILGSANIWDQDRVILYEIYLLCNLDGEISD